MSRTYREFGDLLSAYNEADEKWTPIQKAHELLDSVNEDEIWKERQTATNALFEYISELVAERDQAKAMVNMWIPVSERLPELDQDVLAIVEGDIVTGHFYQQWDGEIYFSSDDEGAMMVATHWMPLPKFPEVQE